MLNYLVYPIDIQISTLVYIPGSGTNFTTKIRYPFVVLMEEMCVCARVTQHHHCRHDVVYWCLVGSVVDKAYSYHYLD